MFFIYENPLLTYERSALTIMPEKTLSMPQANSGDLFPRRQALTAREGFM
jgi:hypothetical protein